MQYASCSSALRKEEQGGEGKRKRVHLCIQILTKKPLLLSQTSRCMVGVRGISSALSPLFPFPWVPALSFVTIKKLECL